MIYLLLFLLYGALYSTLLYKNRIHPTSKGSTQQLKFEPKRLLVIGATGGTGRQLVKQALEQGYKVTAFARTPSKISSEHPNLTIVKGDVLDFDSVEQAVKSQDAVLCALGHNKFFYPTHILSEGTRNILRAMKVHEVSRIVCETSLGIGDSAGKMGLYYTFFTIPVILPFYFWDKVRQEKAIASSDLAWTIVRPGVLTNGKRRGKYKEGTNVGSYFITVRISRGDVADYMLGQLKRDTTVGKTTGVCW